LFDTYYHLYNRGVNRGNIFIEERNYEYFLKRYEKHITPVIALALANVLGEWTGGRRNAR